MKIIKLFLISICAIMILSPNILAIGEVFDRGDIWLKDGIGNTYQTMDTRELNETLTKIYNILLAIATGAAIIVGAILGIKFMMAGLDEKVEVKQALFPYLISCVVVFGSFGIWKLTVTVMRDITPSPDTTITTTQSSDASTTQQSSSDSGGITTREKLI